MFSCKASHGDVIIPEKINRYVNVSERDPPFSGLYKGEHSAGRDAKAELELKIDLDELREYSEVLHMISGSITKTSDRRLNWFKSNKAMYFCSIPGEARLEIPPNSMNYERNITTKVLARRSDGAKFYGEFSSS
ncbi:uncharacterized protein LOC144747600 [Ciona intestinalis]